MTDFPTDATEFRKLTLSPDDIVHEEGVAGRLLPDVFIGGGGMLRWVRDDDKRFSAGFTRMPPGGSWATFFWYNEFWIVMKGTGHVVSTNRVTGKTLEETLSPGDAVFIPEGCHISARTNEDWTYFWCAVPCGRVCQDWLANLEPSDIDDAQLRD
jgi:mannose-6-phosphate isomerase-like protein (cupin superfamily)